MLSPSAHVTTSSSINCLFSLFQQDEANIRLNAALGEIQTVRAYFSYARVVPRAQTIKNERDAGQDETGRLSDRPVELCCTHKYDMWRYP